MAGLHLQGVVLAWSQDLNSQPPRSAAWLAAFADPGGGLTLALDSCIVETTCSARDTLLLTLEAAEARHAAGTLRRIEPPRGPARDPKPPRVLAAGASHQSDATVRASGLTLLFLRSTGDLYRRRRSVPV